jgi:DNA primase
MNNDDPIVEAFVANYGIKNLLDDLNARKVHSTGKNQLILCCLFHDEMNESFSINTLTGLWKCFGCGLVGNLYQFVSLSYNIDYQEARKFIAKRAGLSLDSNIEDVIFFRDLNLALTEEKNEDDIVWPSFSKQQIDSFYEKPDPYNYLENRGFTKETIAYFECGFTSNWRSFNEEKQIFEGQDRVIIPGHDNFGNYVGFIGRTPINEEPKYKYTKSYPKSHTLFNLHRAKHYSNSLILVEGSLDVMNVHQLGYPNVVAILGASLSKYQCKLILENTQRVYLMFDNDKAGKIATQKAAEMLVEKIYTLKIVSLKGIKDPGEIKNKQTLDEFLNKSFDWFEYNVKEVSKKWQ